MAKKFSSTTPNYGEQYQDSLTGYSPSTVGRCYTTHPPLPLGEFVIYGGSCSQPIVKDADIYIGFDYMQVSQVYPWEEQSGPLHVNFPISDMHAPSDADKFKKLITWVCEQLQAGKKIHAGCIGGHGRTGTFLAAVVKEMLGEEDAITYVRKHYCKKAVESDAQIEFLHKHFGVTKISGSKSGRTHTPTAAPGNTTMWPGYFQDTHVPKAPPTKKSASAPFANASRTISPVVSARCLWTEQK